MEIVYISIGIDREILERQKILGSFFVVSESINLIDLLRILLKKITGLRG